MPYQDEPISIVEDLDPEPPPRSLLTRFAGTRTSMFGPWWELVLGSALLVGVLGFAGWQWLQQVTLQNNYAAAYDAVARHDWEAARSLFASIPGYYDSDRQAQRAADMIAQRDNQYQLAMAGKNTGNWAACLKSIQQVITIQPDYKDTAQIEQQASEQVYRDAMSGTIALRSKASPPGLYYYGQSGWRLLPKSDSKSKVRGESPGGWIVYDIPSRSAGSGRHLMVMPITDPSKARELALDAGRYDTFQVGEEGVWALQNDDSEFLINPDSFQISRAPVRFGSVGLNAQLTVYESYTGTLTSTMKLPDPVPNADKDLVIVAFDPNSSRYLLAASSGQGNSTASITSRRNVSDPHAAINPYFTQVGSDLQSVTTTNLYLGDAGGDLKSIYTLHGAGFASAQFSQDGRYALVNTYIPLDWAQQRNEVILLDLQGAKPQVTLASSVAHARITTSRGLWLNSTFLRGGPFDGDILIAEYTGRDYRIRVYNADSPAGRLADLLVPSADLVVWTARPGNDDMSLISGQELHIDAYTNVEGPGALWIVSLSRKVPSAVTGLATPLGSYADYARLVGDQLAYSSYNESWNGRNRRSVFSFPISRFGTTAQRVLAGTMFNQASYDKGQDMFSSGDYSLGPTTFAYISGNDLHARLYDSSVDVVLEQDVTYLYDTSLHTGDGPLR